MRIVFMGTPEFAIPSLKILLQNRYDVSAVVTVPDKPSGRGLKLTHSPVKQFAIDNKLEIFQPERMKDEHFIAQLKFLQPDIMVVVAFRILPPEVYTIPRYGSFNLHASLLPKYRGAAPINWSIIRGEHETGVTTFFLKESVDTGGIILQARTPIGSEQTAGELHDKLAEIGAEIVLHTVRLIESGRAVPRPQDELIATDAPKIFKDHCRIDWTKSPEEIHNFIRGLSPKPVAYTIYNGTLLKIYRSAFGGDLPRGNAGEILDADRKLIVGTGARAIEILEIQQEGKKTMKTGEFLRGFKFDLGERFS